MFLKVFVLFFMLKLISGEENCYSSLDEQSKPFKHFATKTIYSMVNGSAQYSIAGCTTVKVWILSRHGAVYPNASTFDFDDLSATLNTLRTEIEGNSMKTLCPNDSTLLNAWIFNSNGKDNSDHLTTEGLREMKTLADAYKEGFGSNTDLLDIEKIRFRHTTEHRSKQSVLEFASNLFGIEKDDILEEDDDLLKFYEKCPTWKANRDELSGSESKPSKFENSPFFKQTIKDISTRLGYPDTEQLDVEKVKKMWDMCRYDKAWDMASESAWCSAFTSEQVNVLEYDEDLKLYFTTGQGGKINSRLACHTVVDLLDHLENKTSSSPMTIISFADAEALQLLLTTLGTHNDTVEPPEEDLNDLSDMNRRKWKSSVISPYASNLVVVKYTCDEEEIVKVFLNQHELQLDWCENDKCKLKEFIENYRWMEKCDETFCPNMAATLYGVFGMVILAVSLILIY
ncbi:Multiple inositol polyphosphate phosphatase 1 [Pseudolycoriella hygida]|uniref:Multiple inositol polyphosphate phosphatase 1 n=1 Tax=Pseudolycoriella hygida TaxID=35572 RepID=A0A9Q0N226_9DIPT|nr:Multiple inositol polyphosphate phosphatase 1 [Pseudolycoriella hygida]